MSIVERELVAHRTRNALHSLLLSDASMALGGAIGWW
jgi:hypothetical protein